MLSTMQPPTSTLHSVRPHLKKREVEKQEKENLDKHTKSNNFHTLEKDSLVRDYRGASPVPVIGSPFTIEETETLELSYLTSFLENNKLGIYIWNRVE